MSESRKCHFCEGEDAGCSICGGTGFDIRDTDTPVCPYCGHEMSTDDLYESTTRYCYECEHDVEIEIEYTPSYTTAKGDKADVDYKKNKEGIASARRFLDGGDAVTAAYVVMQLPIAKDLGLDGEASAIRDARGSLNDKMAPLFTRIEEAWKVKETPHEHRAALKEGE